MGLALLSYLGAFIFKLPLPNELVPWSDTTHQPQLFTALFKIHLVLSVQLRDSHSLILTYILVVCQCVALTYKLYHLIFKSHCMD